MFVNDSLIYSYIRSPQPHSYLANLAQGGSLLIVPAEKLPDSLTPIIEHSRKTFSSFNPKIYTIDVMFDETERPWVVELNSMPGLYFTPEEKPSMERLYAELLTVFQNKLGQYPSPDTLFSAVPATKSSLKNTPASTMKITVICKNTEWQVQKLCEAAAELGCDIDVKDISTPGILPADLGDIVIWRSSSLGCGPERLEMMRLIMMKRTLINRCLAQLPRATEKVFQQEYVSQKTKWVRCIPTFVFHSVDERTEAIKSGLLRYPFIQKPNNGSKGKGVELINNEHELGQFTQDIHRQVYQNFIRNSGDYRAFILGGRLLGAIKRTPAKGEFLNNISRGGRAEVVTDPKILSELRRIGTVVASIFELSLCGVDIIFDEETRTYFFLEVNTVPQWKGFQEATGIDVGREIIQYGQRLIRRRESSSLPELISEEYLSQMRFLGEKKFHFLSRIFLWSNDPSLMKNLNELQKEYIGISQSDHRKILEKISTRKTLLETRMIAKEKRQVFFEKYPDLEPFLNLLFKNLFSREIYGRHLRPHIRKIVSETELIELKNALEDDPQAMQVLSTHAINYLYLVDDYLQTPASQVNPEKYFQIGISSTGESLKLRLYFFTHCIIGASKFYSTKIRQADLAIYTKMLRAAESIIKDDFQKISLDNKFEFLVCAKICGYVSEIEELILSEASRSLAPDGNFLIDTENETATPDGGNDFVGAEHRNVLYIMSQTPFRPHDTNSP